MEVIFKQDSSFFNIESKDIFAGKNVTRALNNDVISLTITDELGKMATGSLTLNDPNGVYSKIFRSGINFEIEYGYKKFGVLSNKITGFTQNPDEIVGGGSRSGLKVLSQSPSGNFDAGGNTTYTMTFFGDEFDPLKSKQLFSSGDKKIMIQEVFKELGVIDTIIDFNGMTTSLSKKNSVRMWESNFKFLLRKAHEYQALFHIGHTPLGSKIGLFIDHDKFESPTTQEFIKKQIGSAIGSKRTLFYNSGSQSNVISGSWKQNVGANGTGDGITTQIINGKTVITRRVVKDQKVTSWVLNPDKIRAELNSKSNISDKTALTKELLSAKDFESVKRFFDPIETTTAPQGLGFEIDLEMRGDPMLATPTEIIFKDNFPPLLMQTANKDSLIRFYVQSVTHSFSKSGYKTNAKVGDTHAIGGTFLNTGGTVQ